MAHILSDHAFVHLVGWAPEHMFPDEPSEGKPCPGAYKIRGRELLPMSELNYEEWEYNEA